MAKYYLMEFDGDYCDEFSVRGFSVITLDQYKMYQFVLDNQDDYKGNSYIGFGSNQEIYFENISEFLDCITVEEISNNDVKTLNRCFGDNYGLVHPIKEVEYFAEELGYKKQPIIKEPTLYKIVNPNSDIAWLINATKDDIINYAKHVDVSNRDKITNITQAVEVIEENPFAFVFKQYGYLNNTKTAMIIGTSSNEFVSLHEFLLKHDYWYKQENDLTGK